VIWPGDLHQHLVDQRAFGVESVQAYMREAVVMNLLALSQGGVTEKVHAPLKVFLNCYWVFLFLCCILVGS
jgi:hypothetical protein